VSAACATLASTAWNGTTDATYAEIMGCENSCKVAAAGWPVPFIADYPGLSPAGSASLFGAAMGEDIVQPLPLAASLLFWLVIFIGATSAISRYQYRKHHT
jgi:hypothetical protein